nr:MAG TPA: hypothetical protein [Caudoviricetes sp.]
MHWKCYHSQARSFLTYLSLLNHHLKSPPFKEKTFQKVLTYHAMRGIMKTVKR